MVVLKVEPQGLTLTGTRCRPATRGSASSREQTLSLYEGRKVITTLPGLFV
jgi:hypothetical protein